MVVDHFFFVPPPFNLISPYAVLNIEVICECQFDLFLHIDCNCRADLMSSEQHSGWLDRVLSLRQYTGHLCSPPRSEPEYCRIKERTDRPALLCFANLPDKLPLNPELDFVRGVDGLDKENFLHTAVAQYVLF